MKSYLEALPRWDNIIGSFTNRRQNNGLLDVDEEDFVEPTGMSIVEKVKQWVFTSFQLLSKSTEVYGIHVSSQNLLEVAFVESKHRIRKKKILNKRSMTEFEVPYEKIVQVEEMDDNE